MALGATFILPPLIGLTLPALLAWFMYFGLLLAGRTPKGRPPAWDAGVAVPPPGRGEEPEPVAAAAGGGDIVEGDAMEIPGVDENPNAARRERAKKRKRKRRRRCKALVARSCLMILADGARAETFESLLEAGDLPAIAEHVVERGSYRRGTSVFTSTTGPAHIPLLSGLLPGHGGRPRLSMVRPRSLPRTRARRPARAAELQRAGGRVSAQ